MDDTNWEKVSNNSISIEETIRSTKGSPQEIISNDSVLKISKSNVALGEKISNKSSNIEETIQPINDSPQEIITSNGSELGAKGNGCKESVEVKAVKEVSLAKQKDIIEIINVELVAAGRGNNVNVDTSEDLAMNNSNVYDEKEKMFLEISGTEVQEIETESQNFNEAIFQDNEMVMANIENHKLHETISNTLQPLCSAVPNSLSLLAQYNSDDDDSDSVIEVPNTSVQDYRSQVVEIDSDSVTDDSTDSSDVEYLNVVCKTIEKHIEVADEDQEDEDGNEDNIGKKRRPTSSKLRVKGELLLEDLPPIQELQITVPEDECIALGEIHSIVDQLILVSTLPNSILLDLETIIFLEKGQKVLGQVFDVLGQVADPLYCVRFNSNKQIKEKQINIGDVVYVAPKTQYTQYVILSNLMRVKGSDASWENDVEPPPRFLDYSDDEQEQLARRQLRNKDRPIDNEDRNKRPRPADIEGDSTSNKFNNSNTHHRNQYNDQRNSRGGPSGSSNVNIRPRYNGPPQNQHCAPNHHRSSWHSNYYPQSFSSYPRGSFGMRAILNQPQTSQTYPPRVPVYHMPSVHNMPYPATQPTQYGTPPMLHQHVPHIMPNTYSIRPPTLHGPPPHHVPQEHEYTSNPPPPPGSQ